MISSAAAFQECADLKVDSVNEKAEFLNVTHPSEDCLLKLIHRAKAVNVKKIVFLFTQPTQKDGWQKALSAVVMPDDATDIVLELHFVNLPSRELLAFLQECLPTSPSSSETLRVKITFINDPADSASESEAKRILEEKGITFSIDETAHSTSHTQNGVTDTIQKAHQEETNTTEGVVQQVTSSSTTISSSSSNSSHDKTINKTGGSENPWVCSKCLLRSKRKQEKKHARRHRRSRKKKRRHASDPSNMFSSRFAD